MEKSILEKLEHAQSIILSALEDTLNPELERDLIIVTGKIINIRFKLSDPGPAPRPNMHISAPIE